MEQVLAKLFVAAAAAALNHKAGTTEMAQILAKQSPQELLKLKLACEAIKQRRAHHGLHLNPALVEFVCQAVDFALKAKLVITAAERVAEKKKAKAIPQRKKRWWHFLKAS